MFKFKTFRPHAGAFYEIFRKSVRFQLRVKEMQVKILLFVHPGVKSYHAIFLGFSRFFHYLGSIKLDLKSMQDTCALRCVCV